MVDRAIIRTKLSFAEARLNDFLKVRRVITVSLAEEMKDLVGLRNLIVHAYDKLNARKIHSSLPGRRRAIARFLKAVVSYAKL